MVLGKLKGDLENYPSGVRNELRCLVQSLMLVNQNKNVSKNHLLNSEGDLQFLFFHTYFHISQLYVFQTETNRFYQKNTENTKSADKLTSHHKIRACMVCRPF